MTSEDYTNGFKDGYQEGFRDGQGAQEKIHEKIQLKKVFSFSLLKKHFKLKI